MPTTPTLGVDKFALYIGVNEFNASNAFVGSSAIVVNKANLISGSVVATRFQVCTSGVVGILTPQGVDNDDPAATQGYFVGVDGQLFSLLGIRRITNPGGCRRCRRS